MLYFTSLIFTLNPVGVVGSGSLAGWLQLVSRAFETRSMSQQVDLLRKAVRPGHSVLPNIRLTEAGTDLITILMCSLLFKTVLTS